MKHVCAVLVLVFVSACAHPPVIPPVVDNRLPHWTDAMSDGCSTTFNAFRSRYADVEIKLNQLHFSDEEHACCVVHDHKYYDGGSEQDRLQADKDLRQCFISTGSGLIGRIEARIRADVTYNLVRQHGGPEGRIDGVSWDNGPRDHPKFEYTAVPRQEREQ